MKRQFLGRLLSLFLVGTVVAGVGCKDYDDDITSLNNRIDELTTGQIASVEKQMQSLQNAVDRLDGTTQWRRGGGRRLFDQCPKRYVECVADDAKCFDRGI